MNITNRYSDNVIKYNIPDTFIFFSLDNFSENLQKKKSKLIDSNTISQQARPTTITALKN